MPSSLCGQNMTDTAGRRECSIASIVPLSRLHISPLRVFKGEGSCAFCRAEADILIYHSGPLQTYSEYGHVQDGLLSRTHIRVKICVVENHILKHNHTIKFYSNE